jgi:hypothetical protein
MTPVKKGVNKLLNVFGYSIVRRTGDTPVKGKYDDIAVELDKDDIDIIKYVANSGYTMTSIPRLINTLKSCRYVVENNVPGDFVECGVWRGGNGILAKKVFERLGSDKRVWMFDTFEGMTEPGDLDVSARTKTSAKAKFDARQKETHNEWCFASLEDVRENCIKSNIDLSSVLFIKGDVAKTLRVHQNIPEMISVLRLDTDWYESTKVELEVLYPLLSKSGVLIIDDYGYWEGARKAVDEYFKNNSYKPLFNVIDDTGRSSIKI